MFDGHGREFRARVEQIGREGAVARLIAAIESVPEPAVRLTLAQSAIKGDKMDDVIRDATMMGVAAIEPLVTEHTAAQLKPGRAPDRWRRIAIASAKQCGRAVVPSIGRGATLPEWLAADRSSVRLLLLEPSAGDRETGTAPVSGAARPAARLGVAARRTGGRVERRRDRGCDCRGLRASHARPAHAARRCRRDCRDRRPAVRMGRSVIHEGRSR